MAVKRGVQARDQTIRAYHTFNRLLRWTLGKSLAFMYRLKPEGLDILKKTSPPYLILANHGNFWDPFFIGSCVSRPVYYVTSDAQFRHPLMRFLLGLVGSIPKTKMISDFETVRQIMRIRQRRGVIGIFPEGRRTWDGHTLPVLFPTAKLIKLLKIPVIIVLLKGSYLSLPRWTKRRRKGEVAIKFNLGLSLEEIKELSVEKIHQKLVRLLEYDEFEFQREHMIAFSGRSRAEFLERVLFICPHCRTLGKLHSRRSRFFCRRCGYVTYYNRFGFFERRSQRLYFDTIREWNLWQLAHLKNLLVSLKAQGVVGPVFRDRQVLAFTGYRRIRLRRPRFGNMVLFVDRVEFNPLNLRKIVFPIAELAGVNVQNNGALEFYAGGILYSFRFLNERTSSYKWMNALNLLKQGETSESFKRSNTG